MKSSTSEEYGNSSINQASGMETGTRRKSQMYQSEDGSLIENQYSTPGTSVRLHSTYIPYVKYILLLNCFVSLVFYGFNATLATYFQSGFGFTEGQSGFCVNIFISLNYVFSLIGGIAADEYFGKLSALNLSVWILSFSLFLITGFSAASYWYEPLQYGFFLGLFIFTIGNGAIIPCISAFLGDQFLPHQEEQRSVYYSWYYLFTQVGSIVSTFAAPFLLNYSPPLLFALYLGVLLVTSTAFTCYQKDYRKVAPVRGIYSMTLGVLWLGIKSRLCCCALNKTDRERQKRHWLDVALDTYSREDVEDVKVAIRVLVVFLPMPFFWAIYFQIFSLWVFMAEQMDNVVYGITIPPDSITSLNPLFDLFLIPLLAVGIYPLFERCGLPIKPLQKMTTGLGFTVVALLVAAAVQYYMQENTLSILWMIPQFFFISCAEIFLSVTAIEFAYTQAPKRMKSALSAAWFFTVALGNVFVAVVALIDLKNATEELLLFAALIALITAIFIVIAAFYRYNESPIL